MMEKLWTQSLQQSMSGEGGEGNPAQKGQWSPRIDLMRVAVHSHVLPNGKVLYWGRRDCCPPDKLQEEVSLHQSECVPLVWDPKHPNEEPIETEPKRPTTNVDGTEVTVNLFCGGHAFLPDGRLLVAGGHDGGDGNGLKQACIYDCWENTWTPLPWMREGRWYPTVTTLADGTLLVTSGSYYADAVSEFSDDIGPEDVAAEIPATAFANNTIPQIWDNERKNWKYLDNAKFVFPLYPCMHVAPDGRVFMSGPLAMTGLLDTSKSDKHAWSKCGTRISGYRDYAASVMYDTGKVIYIGGGNNKEDGKPTNIAETINLNEEKPQWKRTARMQFPRRQHNATILADGTVLVTGGTQGGGIEKDNPARGFNDLSDGMPVHVAELWDPVTENWTEMATEGVDRCYHSTAVLLPDATVLTAGGGEYFDKKNGKELNDHNHFDGQVFRPPYLFRGEAPMITSPPPKIKYGQSFKLEVSEEPKIGKVTWIGLSSVTHSFNHNQRLNSLTFTHNKKELTVTAPAGPEICPPGHYMLFAISEVSERGAHGIPSKGGVPSEAKIIQIVSDVAVSSRVVSPAPAEAEQDTGPAETMYAGEFNEVIMARSAGTHVTVGLAPQCPYGLGPCWAGAYAALTELSGVRAVLPMANYEDSTAEVYLYDDGLPDLDRWPEHFVQATNGSYDFRGVEVTITGTVQQHNGTLHLTGRSFGPVTLKPLTPDVSDVKVQWDPSARKARPVTEDESGAYRQVETRYRDLTGEAEPMRMTGPLTKTDTEWILYVRVVEPPSGVNPQESGAE